MTPKLTLNSQVKIHKEVLFQELQGESVLLNLTTGVYFGLDSISTRIWQLMQQYEAVPRFMEIMLQEYDVTEEKLGADLLNLVGQMEMQGLLVIVG